MTNTTANTLKAFPIAAGNSSSIGIFKLIGPAHRTQILQHQRKDLTPAQARGFAAKINAALAAGTTLDLAHWELVGTEPAPAPAPAPAKPAPKRKRKPAAPKTPA